MKYDIQFFQPCALKNFLCLPLHIVSLLLSIKCLVDCLLIVDRRFSQFLLCSWYIGFFLPSFPSLFLARMMVFCSSPLLGHLYFLHVWSDLPHLLLVSGLAALKISFVLLKTFDISIWFPSCTREKVHYYSTVDPFSPKMNRQIVGQNISPQMLVRSRLVIRSNSAVWLLSNLDLTNRGQILIPWFINTL